MLIASADYPSEKSVIVSDVSKQLWCNSIIPRCMRLRRDRFHLRHCTTTSHTYCTHSSDGQLYHITNYIRTNLIYCATMYHSLSFVAEWDVRKASIAGFTVESSKDICDGNGRWTTDMDNRMKKHYFYCRIPLLPATPRWSNKSRETPWWETAKLLPYASPYWSCTPVLWFRMVLDTTPSPLFYGLSVTD